MIIIHGYEELRIPIGIKKEMILDAIEHNHGAIQPCSWNKSLFHCFFYREKDGKRYAQLRFNIKGSERETFSIEREF